MRYIKGFSKPEILVKKEEEWTKKFMESDKKRPDSSKYGNPKIKDLLYTMSHRKCYYSETQLKGTNAEIDHFVEVAEDKTKAYQWENLYLSCTNCNNKIPNKDIPVSEVLDPCKDLDKTIEEHLEFEDELIRAKDGSLKGLKTIQKYRLSSAELDAKRMKQLQLFNKTLIDIQRRIIKSGRKSLNEAEKSILLKFKEY